MNRLAAVVLSFAAVLATACASPAGRRGTPLELPGLPGDEPGSWQAAPLRADVSTRLRAARSLVRQGRVGAAVSALRRIAQDEPRALEAHRLLQDLLLTSPSDWWLREQTTRRLEQQPDDADSLYLAGRIEPDHERQRHLFAAALDRDPEHPYARVGRALTLLRKDEHQAALDEALAAAEAAPALLLPWRFMASIALGRGQRELADELYGEIVRRFPDEPYGHLGRMHAAFDDGRLGAASAHAVAAVERAPGEARTVFGAVEVLVEAAVPRDCLRAAELLAATRPGVADSGALDLAIGRLHLAVGDAVRAERALVRARDHGGLLPFEVSRYLRRARIHSGRYAAAVEESVAALPADVTGTPSRYAGRWHRLEQAARSADARPSSEAALAELARALRGVGWRREAAIVRARAAAAAPLDAGLCALASDERAFDRFLSDLAAIARDLRDFRLSGGETPSLDVALSRVRAASERRLGRNVLEGLRVRSYPLLGEVAVSIASTGAFAREFDDRGLFLLIGERRGEGLQIVLGRVVLVRADVSAHVLDQDLMFDECWLETSGLPPDLTGFRGGLAGLTVDRLVLLQLETCLRAPEPLEPGLPFAERPAATDAARFALDTPSAVAQRIALGVAREGGFGAANLDAVRRHELGHVRDARRMLPLGAHPLRALGLVTAAGFDGARVEQTLEGRAAIVALVEAEVPRCALAALLGFLPEREGGTAHRAGYRRAVEIALEIVAEEPAAFPSLRQDRNLVQQMDRLTDDEIRLLGQRLLDEF